MEKNKLKIEKSIFFLTKILIYKAYNHIGDDMRKIRLKNSSSRRPIILIIILLILNILLVISKLDFGDSEIQEVFNYSTSTMKKDNKNHIYSIIENMSDINIKKPETILKNMLGKKYEKK